MPSTEHAQYGGLMLISNFSTPHTKDRIIEKQYIFAISFECQTQKYEPKNNELPRKNRLLSIDDLRHTTKTMNNRLNCLRLF